MPVAAEEPSGRAPSAAAIAHGAQTMHTGVSVEDALRFVQLGLRVGKADNKILWFVQATQPCL